MRKRRALFAFAIMLLTVSSCVRSAAESTSQILGRWQMVGEPGLYEPYLFAENVEFRQAGRLVILLWDKGPDKVWMIGQGQYELLTGNQIKFTGDCWRGYERYSCSRTYNLLLVGDSLRISDDENPPHQVEYRRAGAIGPKLPPTLAPPFPSPTPGGRG